MSPRSSRTIGLRSAWQHRVPGAIGVATLAIAVLAALAYLAAPSTAATVSGAAWTVPMPGGGDPIVMPTGRVLALPCQTGSDPRALSVTRAGAVAWTLPKNGDSGSGGCQRAIGDTSGTTYVQTYDATGSFLKAIDASGTVRWSAATDDLGLARTAPVLGANGNVYISAAGQNYHVLGFDERTGAKTLDLSFSDVYDLYAYRGGLVVVSPGGGAGATSDVQYFSYDGRLLNSYPVPGIVTTSAGADGSVFAAGYSNGALLVSKTTPQGSAWSWATTNISTTLYGAAVTATPDGGVVLSRYEDQSPGSVAFTSLDPAGRPRWDHLVVGPLPNAYYGAAFPAIVDANGVVAVPTPYTFSCPDGSPGPCIGTKVEFLSQQSGAPALPTLQVTDAADNGFPLDGRAIDTDRVYLTRPDSPNPSLSAFPVPGLAKDYQLVLQEGVQGTPPPPPPLPPPPPGPPPVTVAPPPPPGPPLPVVVVPGGGSGVAGAQDLAAYEHGNCDPGASNHWLHVAGKTFTCMASLQFWSEPGLVSAKKKCLVNLAIDAPTFGKALKAPKYIRAAGELKYSLKAIAKSIRSASYPGKTAGDAKAVGDILSNLSAIKSPEDALLTLVSARRVLDGLIRKLGGPGSKLAKNIALLRTATEKFIETVTGIQDVKDCVTAFNGP